MWISGFFLAVTSIWRRLIFLSRYGRRDIQIFADFAAKEFANPNSVKLHKLPNDFSIWLSRIERQLKLEEYFPIGCRLGTFSHSPVLQLRDHFNKSLMARRSPWSEESLENDYRKVTSLAPEIDAVMERDVGYSVRKFSKDLASLLHEDPALAYLLRCREIQLAVAHHAGKSEVHFPLKASLTDQFARLRGNIIAHAAALTMHEYLWSIVTAIRNAKELDDQQKMITRALNALNLRKADEAKRLDPEARDQNYDAILDSMAVSVPALRDAATRMEHIRQTGLDEVHALLGGSKGKGGDRTKAPLVHYYGLIWERLLPLGTFEILAVMVRLHRARPSLGAYPNNKKSTNPAGRLTGDVVNAMPISPAGDWNETMRRVTLTLRCYLPPAHNLCGGGRFDPSLLLNPTKDWWAFERAARGDLSGQRGQRGSFTETFDEIRNRLAHASRLFALATNLVVARPNAKPRQAARRELGSKIVALLASSLTIVTSEPVFTALLKDGLKRTGFQQTRGKMGKANGTKHAVVAAIPTRATAMPRLQSKASITDRVDRDYGRHWGRKVSTGDPAGNDGKPRNGDAESMKGMT